MLNHRKIIGKVISEEDFNNLSFGWKSIKDILPPQDKKVLITTLLFNSEYANKSFNNLTEKEKAVIQKRFTTVDKGINEWGVNFIGTGSFDLKVIEGNFKYEYYLHDESYFFCSGAEPSISIVLAWSKYPKPFVNIEFDGIKNTSNKLKGEYIGLFSEIIDKLEIKYID